MSVNRFFGGVRLFRRSYHPAGFEYVKASNKRGPLAYGKESSQYAVLSHALQRSVPLYGFNERAIVHSLNELGYSSTMLSVIGSSNPPSFLHSSPALMELIKFHLADKRISLTENISSETPAEELPTLEELFIKRLEMNLPVAEHLSQLLSQLAIPGPFLLDVSMPELHRLSDDLIYYSSEKDSHDFAWYSKRLAVSCAYMSSELFMAQDKSPNYRETFDFARDKLHRVFTLGEYYNNTEEFAWYTLLSTINLVKSQLARG
ncbi:hypothetical protein HG536_0B05260 [Torulaspora globosa]|uniref:Ubiquinone biosynthesis protein n=1 Tax=Torulaspora globosa TaxID=48254 RepID=A0A7G3ZDS5_9SACH|nr:uncharacterized protein HG536_0B05260 [Torulaspora globosa]QLL31661.1 hypothetical protein HG536_0B05260 [Torulaspora globosa]